MFYISLLFSLLQTVAYRGSTDYRWLDRVEKSDLQDIRNDSNISWAAYHACHQPDNHATPTITALLPLFPDDSKSVAMIRHSMDKIKEAVQLLNPGQIPIITLDQPLYTIAKQMALATPVWRGQVCNPPRGIAY